MRFDDKCKTACKLGLIYPYEKDGMVVDLPTEIIEIYGYRNCIHLIAEKRKGITYELELSKKAYRRMRPFIDQVKGKLLADGRITSSWSDSSILFLVIIIALSESHIMDKTNNS